MVLPSDAWLRLQFVFPTIINIAKILSAHEKTHKTMSLGCAAATSGGSIVNAIDHLADWCYSVLSMKRVKRFLTEYEAVAAQKMNWETESNQSNRLTNGPSGAGAVPAAASKDVRKNGGAGGASSSSSSHRQPKNEAGTASKTTAASTAPSTPTPMPSRSTFDPAARNSGGDGAGSSLRGSVASFHSVQGSPGDAEDVDDMEDDPDQFPPEGAEDEFSDVSFHDAESDDEFDNNDVSETRYYQIYVYLCEFWAWANARELHPYLVWGRACTSTFLID